MEPRRTADMLRLVKCGPMDAPSGREEKDLKNLISDLEDSSGEQTYEIQTILEQRISKGKQEYLVHWKGYPVEEATWVPEDHFDGIDVITQFWKKKNKEKEKQRAAAQQPRRSERQAAKNQTLNK